MDATILGHAIPKNEQLLIENPLGFRAIPVNKRVLQTFPLVHRL
jgi:hypothetical protein